MEAIRILPWYCTLENSCRTWMEKKLRGNADHNSLIQSYHFLYHWILKNWSLYTGVRSLHTSLSVCILPTELFNISNMKNNIPAFLAVFYAKQIEMTFSRAQFRTIKYTAEGSKWMNSTCYPMSVWNWEFPIKIWWRRHSLRGWKWLVIVVVVMMFMVVVNVVVVVVASETFKKAPGVSGYGWGSQRLLMAVVAMVDELTKSFW